MELRITNHFEHRFTERVMGMGEPKSRNEWVFHNKELIKERAEKMVEHGQLFFTGEINHKHRPTRWIKQGNYIIILDEKEDVAITIFKISFGSDNDEYNEKVLDMVLDELYNLEEQTTKLRGDLREINSEITNELADIDLSIEEKDSQLKAIKLEIEQLERDRDSVLSKTEPIEKEINQVEFKKERLIKSILGGGWNKEVNEK